MSCSVVALGLSLTLTTTGCVSSLKQHSIAVAAAATPVVEGAATAYRNAESIHELRQNSDAAEEFDATDRVYNPRRIQPLMTDHEIEVRLSVLAAFQAYTRSLVDVTDGTNSPELEAASRSAGENLGSLGNTLAPSVERTLGIASNTTTQTIVTTTSPGSTSASSTTVENPSTPITPGISGGIGSAVNALAQFLVSKKIKSQLPGIVKTMDPNVEALCRLLQKDLRTLLNLEKIDYDAIVDRQTLFLRSAGMDARHPVIDPGVRRDQIMKLPEIIRQQRATDEQLGDLNAAIARLALTHHALAADAQNNNPQSLKAKLTELAAAGGNLGKF